MAIREIWTGGCKTIIKGMMNESSHFNHHPQELTKLRKDVISREDVNITILKQLSLPENGTF